GLLKGMGARNIGVITLPIFLASLALNNSTPGKLGGEPVRALMLKEHTGNRISKGIATIFAEKSLDILTILLLSVLGLAYMVSVLGFEDVRGMVIVIGIGGSAIIMVILLLVNRGFLRMVNKMMERCTLALTRGNKDSKVYTFFFKLEGAVDRYHTSLGTIRRDPWTGTGVIMLTLAIWINEALRFYLVVLALPGDMYISFPGAIAAIALANILGFILPIGAGNVFGSKSILELLSVGGSTAMAASLLQVATSLWISIPLGVLSLLFLRKRTKVAANQ
ncbi:MAG: flippase-like domain-containing protein, partial [Candidatus Thermoplasmatota archaeon]|nr:flippase-like domain-containing protein [Candidatus Thermoplasmatota archaeon]